MSNFIFSVSLNTLIGALLKKIREKNDLDQVSIGEETNFSASTISKIESGKMNITTDIIFILCSYYQIKPSYFFKIVEKSIEDLAKKKVFIYTDKTWEAHETKEGLKIPPVATIAAASALGLFVPVLGTAITTSIAAAFFLNKREVYKNFNDDIQKTMLPEKLPILSTKQLIGFIDETFENFEVDILNKEDKKSYRDHL